MARAVLFKPPLEKEVQRAVARLFRLVGFTVYHLSQYRPSMVSVGLPDLYVVGHDTAFWFEVKRPIAKGYNPTDRKTWKPRELDPAQGLFRAMMAANRQEYYWGGLLEAEQVLVDKGLATVTGNGVLQLKARAAGR